MLIDELKISIKAGKGGNGVVRWRHEKGKEFAGPSGGNGGNGGSVFVRGQKNISLLTRYKHLKEIVAEKGQDGMRNSMYGKNGEDFILDLPVGTILTNLETNQRFFLEEENQTMEILKGGRGGFGNEHFKASTNTRPEEFTLGKVGEGAVFLIELELIADIGLVGLPNAGKTSLLNVLTETEYKVGDYPFTTLEPNLGALHGFVLADIPGLIEDSSKGKGLGDKFLKHIKRTKILLHCISLENENLDKVYKTIRKELKDYHENLAEKPEFIVLTKTDLVSEKELVAQVKKVKKLIPKVLSVSILDDGAVKKLRDELIKILKKSK